MAGAVIVSSSEDRFLSDIEARALLRELRVGRSRDCYAAAVLMLNLGLRIGEALTLRATDVSKRGRSLSVRTLKRRAEISHTFDVPESVARVLREQLARASAWWLFPGHDPERALTARAVEKTLKAAAARAGIERAVTPHMLRHTRGMAVWSASRDRALVTHDLRHADARSANSYVHADPARYLETTRKIRPIT